MKLLILSAKERENFKYQLAIFNIQIYDHIGFIII